MLTQILRRVPLGLFTPFRAGIHRFPRGSLPRNICVGIVRHAERANRFRLADRVSEIRPLDDRTITFQSVDFMVMDAVYWTGIQGYEGILAEVWKSLCSKSRNVLEIGGNVGLFTVIGGRVAQGSYTVLEPLPGNAAILTGNLGRNGLDHIQVIQAAAIPDATPRLIGLSVPDERRDAPVGAHLVSGTEVAGRSSVRVLTVDGHPFRTLVRGRDLIKIDAEGIESDLLLSALDLLMQSQPTLVVELLPEARNLAQTLAELARRVGYTISIIPAYGSDVIVEVAADELTSDLPSRFHSKDVVLSRAPLPTAPAPAPSPAAAGPRS